MIKRFSLLTPLLLLLVLNCAPTSGALGPVPISAPELNQNDAIPLGRLPQTVRPSHYALDLEIVPSRERFQGEVRIDITLDQAQQRIWLHGNGLTVTEAAVKTANGELIAAKYTQEDPSGVASLNLERPAPAGAAQIQISFAANFETRHNGLYRVTVDGEHYAFTQMESVWTRKAFPCFDEPAFKTRYDITLRIPADQVGISNTREISRETIDDGLQRIRFATTEPLPSYLIAFAVGPLDVVEAPLLPANEFRKRAVPFRGVASKGRGPELAYALEHTPGILEVLERYFEIPYPYDKLDIIAVPEKGGAMENAGAITFSEWLLLVDEKSAPVRQQRAFAYVMAHELAHQWFGNLVTMPWWDDIWLNEAFATWMGWHAVEVWRPQNQAKVSMLEGVFSAMSADSLKSARQIRQPVENEDDIHSAFDGITYRKGGGVLGMFERWLGTEAFRAGLKAYMTKHRHGSATVHDLLASLSTAAGKDVATPFRTFLFQTGLPLIEAKLQCDGAPRVDLRQSRYLPLGSTAETDRLWQLPVCVRYQSGGKVRETCTLMTERAASLTLDAKTCPRWLMPNADGAGYYQFSLNTEALQQLLERGLPHLTIRERMSLRKSLWDAYRRGKIDVDRSLNLAVRLAQDPHPSVASAPMPFIRDAYNWSYADRDTRQNIAKYAQQLYLKKFRQLGWQPKHKESPEQSLMRRQLIRFLLTEGEAPGLREEAARRAANYLALLEKGTDGPLPLSGDIASAAFAIFGETADTETFDAMLKQLKSSRDNVQRIHLLSGLGNNQQSTLAARARNLAFDPKLQATEALRPIWAQLAHPATRAATWQWFKNHVDALIDRLPPRRAASLPLLGTVFCDQAHAADLKQIFHKRARQLAGGTRKVSAALERLSLCAARRDMHEVKFRALFGQKK